VFSGSSENRLSEDVAERLRLACDAARAAGNLTLEFFQSAQLYVEQKADRSPVTEADRQAEQIVRQQIVRRFPDDAILGEEHGEMPGRSGYRWVVDPIDGTKSFIHGVPLYTTLIGVLNGEQPLIGVVHAPALTETVWAVRGGGAWYARGTESPRPARVSSVDRLADSLVVTTEVRSFTRYRPADAVPAFLRLQATAGLTRTWGDGYGYLLVATGRAEVMVDPALNLWDAAPVAPVVEEAGGTFTDWKGHSTVHGGEAVATNGRVAREVLEILRNA
jgi:histidinol phosphatase-like enzyme (inositol monophosphatase family)